MKGQREKALNTDLWKYQGALYISEQDNERSITKPVNRAKLHSTRMSIHFWKAVISRAVVLLRISKNLGLLGEGPEGRPITQHCRWKTTCGCLLVFSIYFFYSEQHLLTEKYLLHTTSHRSSATYCPITNSVCSDIL